MLYFLLTAGNPGHLFWEMKLDIVLFTSPDIYHEVIQWAQLGGGMNEKALAQEQETYVLVSNSWVVKGMPL